MGGWCAWGDEGQLVHPLAPMKQQPWDKRSHIERGGAWLSSHSCARKASETETCKLEFRAEGEIGDRDHEPLSSTVTSRELIRF